MCQPNLQGAKSLVHEDATCITNPVTNMNEVIYFPLKNTLQYLEFHPLRRQLDLMYHDNTVLGILWNIISRAFDIATDVLCGPSKLNLCTVNLNRILNSVSYALEASSVCRAAVLVVRNWLAFEALFDAPRRANAMSCLTAAHSGCSSHWAAEDLRDMQLSPFTASLSPFFGFNRPWHFRPIFVNSVMTLVWLNPACLSMASETCWHIYCVCSLVQRPLPYTCWCLLWICW